MNKPTKQKTKKVVQRVEQQVSYKVPIPLHYEGPVPPPAILERLETILPGAAERIFVMAEKNQKAQIEKQERKDANVAIIAKSEHKENMTALWMAFSVCLVFVICGTLLVIYGHEKIGSALIGTTLVGVIASFLYKRNQQTD